DRPGLDLREPVVPQGRHARLVRGGAQLLVGRSRRDESAQPLVHREQLEDPDAAPVTTGAVRAAGGAEEHGVLVRAADRLADVVAGGVRLTTVETETSCEALADHARETGA